MAGAVAHGDGVHAEGDVAGEAGAEEALVGEPCRGEGGGGPGAPVFPVAGADPVDDDGGGGGGPEGGDHGDAGGAEGYGVEEAHAGNRPGGELGEDVARGVGGGGDEHADEQRDVAHPQQQHDKGCDEDGAGDREGADQAEAVHHEGERDRPAEHRGGDGLLEVVEDPLRDGDLAPDQALDAQAPEAGVAEGAEPEEGGGEAEAELVAGVPEVEGPPDEETDGDPAQEGEAVVAAAGGLGEHDGEDHRGGAEDWAGGGDDEEVEEDEGGDGEGLDPAAVAGEAEEGECEQGHDGEVEAGDGEDVGEALAGEGVADIALVGVVVAQDEAQEQGAAGLAFVAAAGAGDDGAGAVLKGGAGAEPPGVGSRAEGGGGREGLDEVGAAESEGAGDADLRGVEAEVFFAGVEGAFEALEAAGEAEAVAGAEGLRGRA